MGLCFTCIPGVRGKRPDTIMAEFDPYHKWLGILPTEQPPHLYRLLGLTAFEDDPEVIDAAINRQLAHLHRCSDGEHAKQAQAMIREVSQAELFLLDSRAKADYDAQLREQFARLVAVEWQAVEAAQAAAERPVATIFETRVLPATVDPPPIRDTQTVAVRRRSREPGPTMFLFHFFLSHLLFMGGLAAWYWLSPETFPARLAEVIEAFQARR